VINKIFFFRFEEEIGIPSYVDSTQMYGQMNRHLGNPMSGYSTEHSSANPYMESNSGTYKLKCVNNLHFLR